MQFFVGLDVGQANDYTALAIVEKISPYELEASTHMIRDDPRTAHRRTRQIERPAISHCRHLERFPLNTPYPVIVQTVATKLEHPSLKGRSRLVVDATGVGRAIVDLFRQEQVTPLIPVTIHGGNTVTRDGGYVNVPKRDLIGTLQVLLQAERLKFAANMANVDVLLQELRDYCVSISDRGHDSYNARQGAHDDVVLAVALACWDAERYKEPRRPASVSYDTPLQ